MVGGKSRQVVPAVTNQIDAWKVEAGKTIGLAGFNCYEELSTRILGWDAHWFGDGKFDNRILRVRIN